MKKYRKIVSRAAGLFICFLALSSEARNPILPHIYAADPSPHIWSDDKDTLWLYTSHDLPGSNSHDTMTGYHVFSTKDLVNWTDYGRVLGVENVPWASSRAWAIDAVEWKGQYYLVFSMGARNVGTYLAGLAVSSRPEGPFTSLGFIKGVDMGQDPAVFIDKDIPYLYWGAGGNMYAAQLSDDLSAIIPKTKIELSSQLNFAFEGPWVHKINGHYVLSYAGLPNGEWPEAMYFSIGEKPLGPFSFKGTYIDHFPGQAGTNHGGFVKFKDRWITFYHSALNSNGLSTNRSLMAEFVEMGSDGSISKVVPTLKGIDDGIDGRISVKLETENGAAAGGKNDGVRIENSEAGFSGRGYITGFASSLAYTQVLAQTAHQSNYHLKLRYSANKPVKIWGRINSTKINGPTHDYKIITVPATKGFKYFDFGTVSLDRGDNHLMFGIEDGADAEILLIDSVELEFVYPFNRIWRPKQ